MTEAELLLAVKETAAVCGYLSYHTHDSRRSDPGFPDLVLVHPRRPRAESPIVFLELKSAKGRVTSEQAAWLGALNQREGVIATLVYPEDLDDVVRLLTRNAGPLAGREDR